MNGLYIGRWPSQPCRGLHHRTETLRASFCLWSSSEGAELAPRRRPATNGPSYKVPWSPRRIVANISRDCAPHPSCWREGTRCLNRPISESFARAGERSVDKVRPPSTTYRQPEMTSSQRASRQCHAEPSPRRKLQARDKHWPVAVYERPKAGARVPGATRVRFIVLSHGG